MAAVLYCMHRMRASKILKGDPELRYFYHVKRLGFTKGRSQCRCLHPSRLRNVKVDRTVPVPVPPPPRQVITSNPKWMHE